MERKLVVGETVVSRLLLTLRVEELEVGMAVVLSGSFVRLNEGPFKAETKTMKAAKPAKVTARASYIVIGAIVASAKVSQTLHSRHDQNDVSIDNTVSPNACALKTGIKSLYETTCQTIIRRKLTSGLVVNVWILFGFRTGKAA
eukprot:m.224481 g.224481  ORF g.224481 m.224481 type:complete len:144 (+) comp17290_c0_seq5:1103-1534(+)